MAETEIKVKGLKPFGKRIAKRYANLQDMQPAYRRAVALYEAWIKRNFKADGGLHDNASLKWEPLADSTKRNRRKGSSGAQILRDTGSLMRDWERRASSKYGLIRSAHTYSVYHEEGAHIPAMVIKPKKKGGTLAWNGPGGMVFAKSVKTKGHILPQRKIFPVPKQGNKIVRPAFEQHLTKGTR